VQFGDFCEAINRFQNGKMRGPCSRRRWPTSMVADAAATERLHGGCCGGRKMVHFDVVVMSLARQLAG